jgi:NADH:ubiquinone oxidoreductase subunit 6 (subunit J)
MSVEVALVLSVVLIAAVAVALFSKSVSVSLIGLFYASIAVGIIFTVYGSIIVGLLEIITFAGAVSVLLLTAVLMTGESKLAIGADKMKIILLATAIAVIFVAASTFFFGIPSSSSISSPPGPFSPSDLLQFVWLYRPWDLLILLVIFASAMVVVTNLFSKEEVQP